MRLGAQPARLAGLVAEHGGERLAALQHAARVEAGELVGALLQRHAHVAQRRVGVAHDRVHLGAQVEAGTHLGALIADVADVEEGAEEIAAVVGGALGGHVPDAVRAHLAVRLEAGDDVEREVGEAELLDAVVGADAHPAFDGDVVADQPDVLQLGGIGVAALDDVELEHAGPALGLAPGDAVEHQLGVDEIGAHVHAALAAAHRAPTVTSTPTSPCTRSLRSSPSWVR